MVVDREVEDIDELGRRTVRCAWNQWSPSSGGGGARAVGPALSELSPESGMLGTCGQPWHKLSLR